VFSNFSILSFGIMSDIMRVFVFVFVASCCPVFFGGLSKKFRIYQEDAVVLYVFVRVVVSLCDVLC
jgi:hypothetical protein